MALHHMLRAAVQQQAAGPSDPYFEYNTLLLTGDGTNGAQNNTFLDSSTNNFTITRNGNTTQGSFSPYGSNWSNYFISSYLRCSDSTVSQFGTGDFTIEFWFFATASADQIIYDARPNLNGAYATIYLSSGNQPVYYVDTTIQITGSAVTLNAWHHLAISRSGTSTKMFVDGVQSGSTYSDSNNYASSAYTIIGRSGDLLSFSYTGYVSNVRVVKGTALYTTTFTPSTTPLTAVSGTSLLTCQSNRFIDNSSNNFALTVSGTPSVQRFSPFNPTAPYSTSTIGGSGYFDGTGDYLSVPSGSSTAFGTGDFTVECFVYSTSWAATTNFFGNIGASGSTNWGIEVYAGDIRFVSYSTPFLSATQPSINAWHHIAVSRSGTTLSMFVDGIRVATASNSTNFSLTNNVIIGDWYTGGYGLFGYLSNCRVVKGSAVYDPTQSTCTVPTAPLTAITNTSLLCNMTNAGIPDAAMMNDLETVGNAQVSTSVKKYGTGSLAFDGTDDRLPMATSPNFAFGTGDFTIEMWLYSNDVSGGTQRGLLQTSDTVGGLKTTYTTGVAIGQGQNASGGALNGGLVANVAGTFVGSNTASITTGTWYHIALVRSSGTSTLYVNGTSIGSASTTGNCSGQNCVVGGYYSTSYLYNGYIDDLRITKGYARYTTTFTPPTAALPVY